MKQEQQGPVDELRESFHSSQDDNCLISLVFCLASLLDHYRRQLHQLCQELWLLTADSLSTKHVLAAVCDVQKSIRVFVVIVHLRHQCSCSGRQLSVASDKQAQHTPSGGQHPVHEDEDRLFWRQPETLPHHVHELADCQLLRHQIPDPAQLAAGWVDGGNCAESRAEQRVCSG